jgi:DNA-binding response OmpR family regulator
MPVMDGMTLVRQIYEMEMRVPSIIFVSGFGDVDVREAYSLGVEAMMPKPLKRQALLTALEDSLKSREDLWLEPLAATPAKIVHVTEPSLAEASGRCGFQIGRGGCCFNWKEPIAEETEVQLDLSFDRDGLTLQGEGRVRWFDAKQSRIGVEFLYLAPESRQWVIEQMQGKAMFSFIPRC